MNPVDFPETNALFGPPNDLDASQVLSVPAYKGTVERGSLEGAVIVVTAWKPTPEEIVRIIAGQPIFLTFIGGLPPHYPSTCFHTATHPT